MIEQASDILLSPRADYERHAVIFGASHTKIEAYCLPSLAVKLAELLRETSEEDHRLSVTSVTGGRKY